MMPTPAAVVACVQAVAEAITEACKLAQTPAGQAQLQQALDDRKAWDEGVKRFGAWLEAFFSGKLSV